MTQNYWARDLELVTMDLLVGHIKESKGKEVLLIIKQSIQKEIRVKYSVQMTTNVSVTKPSPPLPWDLHVHWEKA